MNGIKSITLSLLMVIGVISCNNKKESAAQSKDSDKTDELNSTWARETSFATPLRSILEPCLESKNYQNKDWEGPNNCAWALEKEIILNLPEYVLRDEQGLKFQTDDSAWRRIPEKNAMVNSYLPKFHVFILKYLSNEKCDQYGIYDPKSDHLVRLQGMFFLHPNNNNFATISNVACREKAKIGRFLKGKGWKIEEIESKSPISGIKWNEEEFAFNEKNGSKENFVYRKLP